MSTENSAKLAEWRKKANEGTLSIAELREIVTLLREGRVSACYASAGAKAKKKEVTLPSAEEMLAMDWDSL